MVNRMSRTGRPRSKRGGHREDELVVVPARGGGEGVRRVGTSTATAAAVDVGELGYLLGCLRFRHDNKFQQNPNSQLKSVLDSAVKQAFPPSSSGASSSSLLSTLKGQWLNITSRLLNCDKISKNGSRASVADWARNPTGLARVVHRAFHASVSHSERRRGADALWAELDGGGGGVGGTGRRGGVVSAVASSRAAGTPQTLALPASLRMLKHAPVGTLESTVVLDCRRAGTGGAALELALDSDEDIGLMNVSGTDTVTSTSSSSVSGFAGSSDDEDDASVLGALGAADMATFKGGDPDAIQRLLYRRFVEALHLEVVGRTPSVLGGRPFQVYPLTGPIQTRISLHDLRRHVEREFRVLQGGVDFAPGTRRRGPRCRTVGQAVKECRVYACRPPKSSTLVWMQVHIGSASSIESSTTKKGATKRAVAFSSSTSVVYHILLQEGGRHAAVSSSSYGPGGQLYGTTTSPKKGVAKMQANLLQWVLAAVDWSVAAPDELSSTLTASAIKSKTNKIYVYRCIDSLSGPDPLDLLRSSSSVEDGTAMGRFRMYDSQLQKAAIVSPSTLDGISMAATSSPHCTEEYGTRVVSRIGSHGGVVLRHSARAQLDRKRSHVQHFGRPEDCPKRRRIRWDVERADSNAATAAVLASSLLTSSCGTLCYPVMDLSSSVPTSYIKCRVVLQGPDVIYGLRSMMEAGDLGIATAGTRGETILDLPSCVRDAPSSSYETIKVVNGAVALS